MSYSIGLGRLGNATQWYLPGTDPLALPQPIAGSPPVAGAIAETTAAPVAPGFLLGGAVAVSGTPDSGPGLLLDVVGAWNSVKNGSFLSDEAGRVTLSGFVHADVVMGGGGDSEVTVVGAKRGNVVTGEGDDTVVVQIATNVFGWVNEFRIATAKGDDTVVVGALDVAAAAAGGDATFASTANNAGAFTGDDAKSLVIASLGSGDDSFAALGLSRDNVNGGVGADTINAGRGADTLTGAGGDDLFIFAAGDGQDVVTDFSPGDDRLLFLGMSVADLAQMLADAVEIGGNTILVRGADSVTLVGLAASDLSLSDLL
jgi:Ca2+-binding RTX toxin-like protein